MIKSMTAFGRAKREGARIPTDYGNIRHIEKNLQKI